MCKKILYLCQMLIIILTVSSIGNSGLNTAHAEDKVIIAEGTAVVGEAETEIQARQRARLDAQRQALEEAGVIITSITTVNNYQLVTDWLQSTAMARVQSTTVSESRSIENNMIVLRVKVKCLVSPQDIVELNGTLRKLTESITKSPTGVDNVKDLLLSDGSRYTGSILNGLPDGRGVKYFPDGGKYDGEFRQGYRQGTGTMIWFNNDHYTGNWLRDMRCGRGEFKSSTGEPRQGRWLNDVFYGD